MIGENLFDIVSQEASVGVFWRSLPFMFRSFGGWCSSALPFSWEELGAICGSRLGLRSLRVPISRGLFPPLIRERGWRGNPRLLGGRCGSAFPIPPPCGEFGPCPRPDFLVTRRIQTIPPPRRTSTPVVSLNIDYQSFIDDVVPIPGDSSRGMMSRIHTFYPMVLFAINIVVMDCCCHPFEYRYDIEKFQYSCLLFMTSLIKLMWRNLSVSVCSTESSLSGSKRVNPSKGYTTQGITPIENEVRDKIMVSINILNLQCVFIGCSLTNNHNNDISWLVKLNNQSWVLNFLLHGHVSLNCMLCVQYNIPLHCLLYFIFSKLICGFYNWSFESIGLFLDDLWEILIFVQLLIETDSVKDQLLLCNADNKFLNRKLHMFAILMNENICSYFPNLILNFRIIWMNVKIVSPLYFRIDGIGTIGLFHPPNPLPSKLQSGLLWDLPIDQLVHEEMSIDTKGTGTNKSYQKMLLESELVSISKPCGYDSEAWYNYCKWNSLELIVNVLTILGNGVVKWNGMKYDRDVYEMDVIQKWTDALSVMEQRQYYYDDKIMSNKMMEKRHWNHVSCLNRIFQSFAGFLHVCCLTWCYENSENWNYSDIGWLLYNIELLIPK